MFDKIKNLAHDKAMHALGGTLVSSVAMSVANPLGRPALSAAAGVGAAAIVGIWFEYRQHRKNKAAKDAGEIPPHDVSGADVAAGVIGGLIVAAPQALPMLIKLAGG